MSMFARRMFMAQNVKRAVAGWEITFTVKEWFLDPDNSFTDTEVGALQYMTVKIGSETKQTDVNGQVVFTLPDGSYTYEVYDNARYLTTYRDDITVSGAAQSISVKCYACLYKPTEVWDMINNSAYVPVASAYELDILRNTGSRTMGANTIFVGSYATGLDKKYVQVANCNLIDYTDFVSIGQSASNFDGEYDGNELFIYNYIQLNARANNAGIFEYTTANCVLENINIIGRLERDAASITTRGMLVYINLGIIQNCNVYGNVKVTDIAGGLCGENKGQILNSSFRGIVNSTREYTGGITGINSNSGIIRNSFVFDSEITCTTRRAGGIAGANLTAGLIEDSYCIDSLINSTTGAFTQSILGSIVGENNAAFVNKSYAVNCDVVGADTRKTWLGGLCGWQRGSSAYINNSYVMFCDVDGASGDRNGGLVGNKAAGSVTNCYAVCMITGSTNIGGLVGFNSGTITNSYYDTTYSGLTDTGKGLPRTTAQMQAGTANSYILPDGTTDPDSLPANAMYLNWDGNIWEFGDATEYPTLK